MRWRADLLSSVLVLLLVSAVPARPAGADQVDEYELKAAFLYNFAKFVRWPEDERASSGAPIRVCTLGGSDLADVIVRVMEGKEVDGHPLAVERIDGLGDARRCNILFVARDSEVSGAAVAGAVRGSSTLTVGESEGFAREGGMVNFVREDKKIRFEINQAAARKADLRISSKLLRLAKLVDG